MPSSDTFTVRLERRIDAIDSASWNRLAADDVYAQHGWLRVVEETVLDACDPHYFLVYDGANLSASAIGYRFNADRSPSSLDKLLFGRLSGWFTGLGVSSVPALFCGPLLGQGRHVLWRRDMPATTLTGLINRTLDAVSGFADDARLTLAFAKLPVDETVLLAALSERGFARTMNWPVAYVDLHWDSFDDYIEHLKEAGSSMATKARREVAAPGKANIELSGDEPFRNLADEIFALFEVTQRAHSNAPIGLAREFVRKLADYHDASSVVTVARRDATLAGAALLLTAGNCAGGPLIGVSDDPRNRKAFTYFNLALYAPIRHCIELGLKRVYLGAGLYSMKRRRGCGVLELAMFIRHRSVVGRIACRIWCVAHRNWAMKKLARQGVCLSAPRPDACSGDDARQTHNNRMSGCL